MRKFFCACILMSALSLAAETVPVIYSTDLFHPHDDPDDHFDLAALFALPEFEIKAVLLDLGKRQLEKPGAIPLRQMLALTGRSVPFASGLGEKLSSPSADGRDQPAQFQGAVELLLKTLRESAKPVTVITAGSLRDVCAAWNREPELLKQKIKRLYINIGTAERGGTEWNVMLDPNAYIGILRSGLPVYLCCCMPMRKNSNSVYSTWWHFRQGDVLETAPRGLQNFFIYALQRPSPQELEPLEALKKDLRPWHRLVWQMDRNMWCTASFLHASGRVTVKNETLFTFVPARVEVDETGKTNISLDGSNANVQLFKITQAEKYEPAMRGCLRELLKSFPQTK